MVTGEATPYYIFHPTAPQRIAKVLPNVKLIALLRNPVDRAYSHYNHMVRVAESLCLLKRPSSTNRNDWLAKRKRSLPILAIPPSIICIIPTSLW